MLSDDKLYPHYRRPKAKDFGWTGFAILAAIGGFQVLRWLENALGLS